VDELSQACHKNRHMRRRLIATVLSIVAISGVSGVTPAFAANGSATYTYDALGRVSTVSYDSNVIVIYTYDANGNRTSQVINVNTKNLCLGTSAHGNPTQWGTGLWSTAASGC
jgi:YD repeat-containing protein